MSLGQEKNKDIICGAKGVASSDIIELVDGEVDGAVVKVVRHY